MEGTFYHLDLRGVNLWYLLAVFLIPLIVNIIYSAKLTLLDIRGVSWMKWAKILTWPKFYRVAIAEITIAVLLIPILARNLDLFICGFTSIIGCTVISFPILAIALLLSARTK